MKLKTNCGYEFEIDDKNYEKVMQHATSFSKVSNGSIQFWSKILKSSVILSRFLLGCPYDNGLDAEHKDRNKANNKEENLRWATRSQNLANKDKNKNNTSGYKGVSWNKHHNKWQAIVGFNKKLKHLGYFDTAIEAAKAYDKKAFELWGEFSMLNFSTEQACFLLYSQHSV